MLIGSNFTTQISNGQVRCSECGERIEKGKKCLVSIQNGRVKKRVCSESCRLDFDDSYWQGKADERQLWDEHP